MTSPYVTPFYRGRLMKLGIYDYGSRCGSAFPYKLQTGCTWGSAGEDSFMWTHAFLLVYVQPLPSLTTTLRHSTGSWPTNYGAQLLHYLDDFLLVGPPGKDTCQEAMSRMLTVCDQLGIPVASEKLEGPTTALTFLGIVLDTSAQQLRLPPDKLEELTGLIRSWLSRHKATKRELLSLIGKLSFAAKLGSFTITSALMQKQEPTLGALGSGVTGSHTNASQLRSIQWQELFAIVAAASTWGHLWAGLRIHFHCDNLPIVQAWARQSAKHPDLMRLLQTLFLVAAQHSFTIRLSHLPGRLNSIADALSRNNLPLFFTLAPQADPQPTPTPHHLPET
eukprot:Em0003g1349a